MNEVEQIREALERARRYAPEMPHEGEWEETFAKALALLDGAVFLSAEQAIHLHLLAECDDALLPQCSICAAILALLAPRQPDEPETSWA